MLFYDSSPPLILLLLQLESKLVEEPCCVIGCMLETEFAEAMEKLVPTASDVLCHRLFLQSLLLFQDKNDSSRQTLPTKNLACILPKTKLNFYTILTLKFLNNY